MEWLIAVVILLQLHSERISHFNRKLLKEIKMNSDEAAAAIAAQTAKLETLDQRIKDLVALVGQTADVPQNIVDAINGLTAQTNTDVADAG